MTKDEAYTIKMIENGLVSNLTQRHLFKAYNIFTLKSHGVFSGQYDLSAGFIVALVCTLSY